MSKEKVEKDIWTELHAQTRAKYIAQGMSADEADDKAAAEIRKMIRES